MGALHLGSIFPLQSLHSSPRSPSSLGSLSPCLITAQTSFSLAHSPRHCEQPFSEAVCAPVVNTSPFFDKFCSIPLFFSRFKTLKTGGCTKTRFFQGQVKNLSTSVTVTHLSLLHPLPPGSCPHLHHLYSIRLAVPLRTAGCERVNSWLEFMLSPSPICSVEWEITFSMRIIEHGQGGASSLPTNHREQGHLSRRQ